MTADVFAPARLGPVALRNRTVKAATFEGRTPYGQVTDDLVDFHVGFARGGVGVTTVAYLAVAPEGRTHAEQVVVGADTLGGLSRLADAVHDAGAAIAGQVGHAGPVANGRSNGVRALSASRMPSPLSMQMIGSASERDLTRITRAYVGAARTLVRAGFDVLELHMAHSYLISSFLAPGLNRRRDRWGGSLQNRARLGRQVARAVREEVGAAAAVTAKVSVGDGFRGGVTTDEGLEFARLLEADGHLDALQMSGGSSLMNPMYLFRGDVPLAEFAASHRLYRWKMHTGHQWSAIDRLASEKPGLVYAVIARIRDDGPITAGDLEQRVGPKGSWWSWDDGKIVLEHLFQRGEVVAVRRKRDFAREYDLPDRVLPASALDAADATEREARQGAAGDRGAGDGRASPRSRT